MLICLGTWSKLNLVKDSNVKQVMGLQDIIGEDVELEDSWDDIIID